MKRGSSIERVYWDSTVFLAWLLPETHRTKDIAAVLDGAERGKVQIVTSAITMTEVIKLKGYQHLKREDEKKIREFFQRSYIISRGVDTFTAIDARELIWKHGLWPKDSLHVATALRADLRILETHDTDLLNLHNKLTTRSNQRLTIRTPHFAETLPLDFNAKKREAQDRKGEAGKDGKKDARTKG